MSEVQTVANPDVVTKYKIAGEIAGRVLEQVKALAVPGAKIVDLCVKGDELLNEELAKVYNNKKVTKGIAFPTCVSPNDCVAHFNPLSTDKEAEIELKTGDVIKISLGAQVDGYPSILADTIVVSESKVEGAVADMIAAAYYATEAALRTFKPGNRNWDVTKVVDEVVKDFDCVPLEGMMSQQHLKDTMDGKKKIILNPSEQQRKDFESVKFEEDEVYGLDVIVTSAGSAKAGPKDTPTTIYKKTALTYQLKLKTSRQAISEIQKKCGNFPFTVRMLEDQKRARMALQEPLNHGLLDAFEVVYAKQGTPVVQLFTTFAITKNGILKFASAPAPDFTKITTTKKVVNEDLVALLNTSLRTNKKKKKAAKTEA